MSLNLNSPIVQNMLKNIPVPGNPMFEFPGGFNYGSTPTVERGSIPYPSPMEMSNNNDFPGADDHGGYTMPNPYYNYNTVGNYQPMIGYEPVLLGQNYGYYQQPQQQYYNPYYNSNMVNYNNYYSQSPVNGQLMNQYQQQVVNNVFTGYNNPFMDSPDFTQNNINNTPGWAYRNPQYADIDFNDPRIPDIQHCAQLNRVSFEKQYRTEKYLERLRKKLYLKNILHKSEEEALEIIEKDEKELIEARKAPPKKVRTCPPMHLHVIFRNPKNLDEILIDSDKSEKWKNKTTADYEYCDIAVANALRIERNNKRIEMMQDIMRANLYNSAIERKADGKDLYYFMNVLGPEIALQMKMEKIRKQKYRSVANVLYDSKAYKLLTESCPDGIRTDGTPYTVLRGGYGYLPGGIPTNPDSDPEIGKAFSIDSTGALHIELPDWIKQRHPIDDGMRNLAQRKLDEARAKYINAAQEVVNKEAYYRALDPNKK